MKVLAIHGSLRADSFSRRLAAAAADLAPEGVEVELYDGLDSVPNYNQDLEPDRIPAGVEDLREKMEASDAILIVTPEYNASVPGALRNAIDWASRPHGDSSLQGRPAAIISNSPMPFGAIWANQQVRKSFTITGTPTVERELAIGKIDERLGEDGTITDQATRDDITSILAELEELTGEVNQAKLEELAA
ncbi:MAG: NAD(P)H-dependent oxidoreductase [Thermoleophilia bacterium]|nr:NAD(P)H-dependent oxidoreductase [Thermoleophilia bacterium]